MNSPLELILSRLSNPQKHGDSYIATCPAHDDKTPSLSLSCGDDGRVLIHCHAGCKTEDVITAIGLEMRELFSSDISREQTHNAQPSSPANVPEWVPLLPVPDEAIRKVPPKHPKHDAPSMVSIYRDANGAPLMVIYRFDLGPDDSGKPRKTFAPLTWCRNTKTGQHEWCWQSLPTPRPLLNLDKLAAQPTTPVVIGEGEKAAKAAPKLTPKHVPTCWSHGATSWQKTDFSPLAGRDVLLFPDNDSVGIKAMQELAAHLRKIGVASVRIVNLSIFSLRPGFDGDRATFTQGGVWSEGDDAADALAKGWTAAHFAELERTGQLFATEPKPIPLLPDLEQPTPYPTWALPLVMKEAAEAIAYHAQVPMAMAGQCVIGAAAYVAQSRVNAHHIGRKDGMPCSLFQLTLGNSGDRKSECHRLAFGPIHKAEKDARRRHKAEADQLKSTADATKGKDRAELQSQLEALQNPQTLFSDATYEPIAAQFIRGMPAASWDTDEGGQMLAGASLKADTRAQTVAGLVKLHDTGEVQRTRSASNLEASGFAYNRRLCLHLLAQPVVVCGALTDPLLQGQGFLPRFLFAAPESLAGTRILTLERMQENPLDDQLLLSFWERVSTLLTSKTCATMEGEIEAPVMQLSASATTIWLAFYNETEHEQGSFGEYAELRPFAGRAGELAKRLATVLAFFAGETEISEDTMRGACALVRHSLAEWLRFLHHVAPNADLVSAQKLLDWLITKGRESFNTRDLQREGPPFIRKSAKQCNSILGVLVEHRWLTTADGKTFKLAPSATAATFATTRATQSPEACDAAATNCDNDTPTHTLSQPVATVSQQPNPATRGLVAGVANVAAPSRLRGEI